MPYILGIKLYDLDIESIVDNVIDTCIINQLKKNYCISATGAHGLVYSKKDKFFQKIIKNFYCNLPDGMPSVWMGRLKGAKKMRRCYGPDFFKTLISKSAIHEINHYFCGGKEGIALELKKNCEEKFQNYHIVGTYSPPFREMNDKEFQILGNKIDLLKTDIIWIGLSTPKQEIFAWRLAQYVHVHFIITVGAAFDFHTGNVRQAPVILQKIGLEWMFRLLMEPRRLYKRYLEIVPLFIFYNISELAGFLIDKLIRRKNAEN